MASTATKSSSSQARFRFPQTIFWVALLLRVLCVVIGHTYRIRHNDHDFDFGFEAGRIAKSLVLGQGYSNPFNGYSGPTAWLPPLYPLLMALAFKLFGIYTRASAFFILSCNCVFSAAVAPAVYEIAARCFDAQGIARRQAKYAEPVALWSAWMWALYPAALQYAIHWIWEMSLTTCLFTWALVLALRLRGVGNDASGGTAAPRYGLWATSGLLWGLIALSNASLLLIFPASILWVIFPKLRSSWSGSSIRTSLVGASLACVVFAALQVPWIVRNERAMHAFVPTRANFGVELWQSTHFYYKGFPWGTAMPLWPGDLEFVHYVRVGEVAFSHEKGQEAVRNIKAHPDLFLRNTAIRFVFFWLGVPHPTEPHPSNEVIRMFNYNFLSLSGLLGLGLALKRRVPGATLFAIVFMLLPAAYYVVTVQGRFRHPLEPLIAILGVYLFRSTTPKNETAA